MAEKASYSTKERLRYWQEPGTQKLLNLLKQEFPQGKWQPSGEHKYQGCCPFHNDSSPSAFINTANGLFMCSSCGEVHTDIVSFFAAAKGLDYATAFKQIVIVELGIKVNKNQEKELELFDAYQQFTQLVAKASCDLLSKAANNMGDSEFGFAHKAVRYLQRRGISLPTAISKGVGVFPRKKDIYHHPDATQRDKALLQELFVKQGVISETPTDVGQYGGYLTFPHYTAPDTIGRIKLRGAEPGGYSAWVGPNDDQGFFGLDTFKTLMSRKTQLSLAETIYVVEGEFDQLSIAQAMDTHGVDTIVVSGSGAGVRDVTDLQHYGFNKIVAVGDNDAGGEKFIARIFREAAEDTDCNASVHAFAYPDVFQDGDDPDEIVKRGDWLKLNDALHDTDNWLENYEWGVQRVEQVCADSDGMDLGKKINLAREYGQLIPEGLMRQNYTEKVADILGLSQRQLTQQIASTDTEKGFIESLKGEFSKMFEPLALDDNVALCYSQVTRRLFRMPCRQDRDKILTLQTQCFETDLTTWVSHTLGVPDFVEEDQSTRKSRPRNLIQQRNMLGDYINTAVDSYISESAVALDEYQIRRQGVHFFDASDDPADKRELPKNCAEKRLVLVNGLDVYIGELEEDPVSGEIKDRVRWRRLEKPVHSTYMLETNDRDYWSKSIRDVNDLNNPVSFQEAKEAWDDIKTLVKTCFDWDEPEIYSIFWAGFCFMQTLSMMTDNFPLASALGATQSGKSTWIKQCLRGDNGYGLIEHSTGYDDYTAAGLTQAAAGSSLLLCIDEFEDADDSTAGKRSAVVQNALEMFRNIAEGSFQTRGTQSGSNRNQYMRFPIAAAHIHPFKREEDLNRWVTCRMTPDRSKRALPPAVKMQNLFDKPHMEELRRRVTLYALQNAGLFYKLDKAVGKEVFDPDKVKCREHRFLHSMTLPLAFAKHFGEDYIGYINDHVKLHEKSLKLSVASEEKRMFRAVFMTKGLILDQDQSKPRTVLEVINDSDLAMRLSGANCGVYYKPGKDYVVVDPYSVANNILQKNPVYRGITNSFSVFQRLKRHPDVHHKPQLLAREVDMQNHLGTYISRIDIEELLVVYLRDLRKMGDPVNDPIEM